MRETPRTVGVAPGRGRGVARREGRTAAAACGAERPDALRSDGSSMSSSSAR